MNQRSAIIAAGISGFLGVALGAFGAHALRDKVTPELLETFRTGVLYHLIHTAVIAVIAFSGRYEKFRSSVMFILIGIILFSFSLYAYVLSGVTALAMITPVGGVSFLTGWALMIYNALKKEF